MSANLESRSRHLLPPSATGIRSRLPQGTYGRLFRSLPPWGFDIQNSETKEYCLRALARNLVTSEGIYPEEHNELPAGYTYLGAFISHDMTFDAATLRQRQIDPDRLTNHRTPALDLDCIYGRGPLDQPYLYERSNFAKFHIGQGVSRREPDLPRIESTAIIADPRNDETILLSQLHLAFLRFHNEIVDYLSPARLSSTSSTRQSGRSVANRWNTFYEAQQVARWHYQWIVIYDFLERILDPEVYLRLKTVVEKHRCTKDPDLIYFNPTNDPFIPIEFSAAAFRFGHSMSRSSYRLNRSLQNDYRERILPETDGLIPLFAPSREAPGARIPGNSPGTFAGEGELLDLSGGRRLPVGWRIDWREFFDSDFPYPFQHAMRINARLSAELGSIPVDGSDELAKEKVPVLPYLDLKRGSALQLPSGQAVARAMGVEKIYSKEDFGLEDVPGQETPLYYYILKESELQFRGRRLGRVGSEIVGEVILGMILLDPGSFASVNPHWKPTLGSKVGEFRMSDLLSFSAVDSAGTLAEPAIVAVEETSKLARPGHCGR